jgi:hypothetical protein
MQKWIFLFAVLWGGLWGKTIPDQVLICGIGRNIAKAVPNTIWSATELGSRFSDYHIIFYENNSTDGTRELLKAWAHKNPKVTLISEKISKRRLVKQFAMGVMNRTESIARARNIVLDEAMKRKYDGYKYVVWADLDFLEPWDVEAIVETVERPEQEWDAVFAYGAYDLFALRSVECPVGFELLGLPYWKNMEQVSERFVLERNGPWKKVYSAFGGLGIYKRAAIKGCRYSGVVTKDLETVTLQWLKNSVAEACFLKEYRELVERVMPVELAGKRVENRELLPEELGVRMKGGRVVWFSCTPGATIPWTCEHVPFHASMILRGHDKLFVNPKMRSNP